MFKFYFLYSVFFSVSTSYFLVFLQRIASSWIYIYLYCLLWIWIISSFLIFSLALRLYHFFLFWKVWTFNSESDLCTVETKVLVQDNIGGNYWRSIKQSKENTKKKNNLPFYYYCIEFMDLDCCYECCYW